MELKNIYNKFSSKEDCILYLEKMLWDDGPICPYCGSNKYSSLHKEQRYHCNWCNTSFSVTTKTVFHKTRIDLQKWFLAIYLVSVNRDISSRQLANYIKVNKNTAWYVINRISKLYKSSKGQYLLHNVIRINEHEGG